VAGQLVNAVPHMDGKFYAATQALDEARHVEVFAAYIQKLDEVYPIAPALKELLDNVLGAEDWKKKAVGMQVVAEGLALYLFRGMRHHNEEPLLKRLLTYVSRDEARHTGYGVKHLSRRAHPRRSRARGAEDFAFEAARLLIDSRVGTPAPERVQALGRGGRRSARGADRDHARPRARGKDAAHRRPDGPIRGFVIPTPTRSDSSVSASAVTEEMFEANVGREAMRRIGAIQDLPEDLDAWERGLRVAVKVDGRCHCGRIRFQAESTRRRSASVTAATSEPDRLGVPRHGAGSGGELRALGRAEDLREDGGQRRQRARVLPGRGSPIYAAALADTPTYSCWIGSLRQRAARRAQAADLVPVCSALVDGPERRGEARPPVAHSGSRSGQSRA
jgi:hypothetical protein